MACTVSSDIIIHIIYPAVPCIFIFVKNRLCMLTVSAYIIILICFNRIVLVSAISMKTSSPIDTTDVSPVNNAEQPPNHSISSAAIAHNRSRSFGFVCFRMTAFAVIVFCVGKGCAGNAREDHERKKDGSESFCCFFHIFSPFLFDRPSLRPVMLLHIRVCYI